MIMGLCKKNIAQYGYFYKKSVYVTKPFTRRRKMNTKRTAVVFLCACMALAFITGCKIQKQHLTTLQGTLFNAATGERIGGTDVVWYLQEGTKTINKPDVFYTGATGSGTTSTDEIGDYAFKDIPSMDTLSTGSTDVLPNEYRLTVIKPGFQRFEGIIGKDMLANQDNVIKNIYLFPDESLIPCYTYTAEFNGKPVPNVKITAAPYATINVNVLATDKWLSIGLNDVLDEAGTPYSILGSAFSVLGLFNNNYFFPAPGYLASLTRTTDATGKASFCTADTTKLTAGCVYAVIVQPTEYFVDTSGTAGVQLAPTVRALVADYSDADQIIHLTTTRDYNNDYGLYVTSISNNVLDQIDTTGTLTITFNRAVTLGIDTAVAPFTSGFGAALAVLPSATVWPAAPASRVNASLSADGLTLTLTPTWTTPPALATEMGQAITYTNNNGYLSVKGYPDSKILLTDLEDTNTNSISLEVQLSRP